MKLNAVAMTVVLAGAGMAVALYYATGSPATTLIGVFAGAVTNAPGLGAAQETYADLSGHVASDMAVGYALAYPLGIVGCILAVWALKHFFRMDTRKEEAEADAGLWNPLELNVCAVNLEICNEAVDGMALCDTYRLVRRSYTVSYVRRVSGQTEMAVDNTLLYIGDRILLVATLADVEAISVFFGKPVDMQWDEADSKFVSRTVSVTQAGLNGMTLAQLDLHRTFGVNVTHVSRSGIDLVATPGLRLQMDDRIMVAGKEMAVNNVRKLLGDSPEELKRPNLFFVFLGIALGCLLGSLPLWLPGMSRPLKLGLAGVLSGAMTSPPALAYVNDQTASDAPAEGYASVYPLTMFVRVLTAQALVFALM